jgi:hypothetical protein
MTITRPAPLGATHKQDVRPGWSNPESYAAPNGARSVLFDRGYKYLAPTELRPTIAKRSAWRSPFAVSFLRFLRLFASISFFAILAFFRGY